MLNNRFSSILRSLSTKELKAFDQYLNGLYAKQTVALRLLEFLYKFRPDFAKQNRMSVEEAHKYVFKKTLKPDDKKARKNILNSLSDLSLWLNEFLLWKEMKKKSYDRELTLLKIYQERECKEAFSSRLKTFQKDLEQPQYSDMWHQLFQLKGHHLLHYSNFSDQLLLSQEQFLKLREHLENFYLAAQLKYACESINRQNVLKEKHSEVNIIQKVEVFSKVYKLNPLHKGYFYVYQLISKRDKTAYYRLRELLFEYDQFTIVDKRIFFGYLLNYCSMRVREGVYYYIYEIFYLYEFVLEQKLIVENGILPLAHFNNIINGATIIGELKWAEIFINEWSKMLDTNTAVIGIKLGKSQLAFAKKDYGRTIEILRTVDLKDIYYNIRVRMLLLACYYEEEKNNANFIFDYSKSFDIFLTRSKIMNESWVESAKNLNRFIRKLLRNKESRLELFDKLQQCENVFFRWWLERKILELK